MKIDKQIILASKSPRRQQLMKILGVDFKVMTKDIEETYPDHLKREEVAVYLSELKSSAFIDELTEEKIIITSDTIVCLDDEIIGKPKNRDHAIKMLEKLSNRKHEVVTAVTIATKGRKKSFFSETEVYFKLLTDEEITYYIDNYEPFDKAGSYGIQEWIGAIGVEKIVGSYFNVMGLPVKELYQEIINF